MNSFTKQKESHRHRKGKKKKLMVTKEVRRDKSLGLTYAHYIFKIDEQQGPTL